MGALMPRWPHLRRHVLRLNRRFALAIHVALLQHMCNCATYGGRGGGGGGRPRRPRPRRRGGAGPPPPPPRARARARA
jgi:hypothetical protein